ncbi:methyl-accepting chemotaxis protein [Pelosinus sp. UFO1]|uniref:methyl-accepting chemotaxis protein n=1 Tax=Pelosinus sp. UFO1 TaxID=484770 RepID=UPI0004D1CB84|nr:methyl-accepting chemotaxis protein [Pelosinus sp. UFO1]AIF50269.1 methyl-accepting chemotaxis sensory transducer with Cache sensor [Pelosinus sp. UFO1]
MSIRTKIICLLVSMIFATGILLSGTYLYSLYQSVHEDNKVNLHNQALQLSDAVDAYVSCIKSTGLAISMNPIIEKGDFIAKQAQLEYFFKAIPGVYILSITDINGSVVNTYPYSAKAISASRADRDYFKAVMTTGQPQISDVIVSKDTGKVAIVFAYPIKSDNAVTGMLIQGVEVDYLQSIISKEQIGKTGYAEIISPSGKFVAHKNKEWVIEGKTISEEVKALIKDSSIIANEITDETGEKNIAAVNSVPSSGWSVLVNVPKKEILENFYHSLKSSLIILFTLAILLSFLSWIILKQMLQHLSMIMEFIGYLGDGELRKKLSINASGELGQLANEVNKTIDKMRDVTFNLVKHSEHIAASSEEMTAGAEQSAQASNQVAVSITEVAQRVNEQLKLVDSTVEVVEEISKEIQQVSQKAMIVSESVKRTEQAANDGERSIETAVRQMGVIEEKTYETANVIGELEEKSKQIGQIVEAIAAIAGQTNLLALNAAIEAARAGETGRGFAVVADEVRKLAEQSQEFAKQIATLIAEIQQKTNNAVLFMNEGRKEVNRGSEVVNLAGKSFREIIQMIREISNQIQGISAATQQIMSGAENVVNAVQGIDKESKIIAEQTETVSAATEEQSASMEEIASASQSLATMAEELQKIIGMFKV